MTAAGGPPGPGLEATIDPAPMTSSLRILVACPRCGLQFDASGLPVGGRFHCACGETLAVPGARPHDAAVVRCSSCGGPRQGSIPACGFCGSDFTLHERDLHTLCPSCMTRISDHGRFCHSCGLPIAPQGSAGELTDRPCPVCGEENRLRGRRFAEGPIGLLECSRCAGVWLGAEAFRALERQAQREETELVEATASGPPAGAPGAGGGPLYRPCVVCGKLMHRRNFGRKSAVIIDTCSAHGVWFDLGELERILAWVRAGGLRRARSAAEEARRQRRRLETPVAMEPPRRRTGGGALADLTEWLLRSLLD